MTADLLDYGPDDIETIVISHLKPLSMAGGVTNIRRSGDPLPSILVNHIDGTECEEESVVDEVVSIHTLFPRANGDATAVRAFRDGAIRTHQRMLLLARDLVDVPLPGGRFADIEYVKVFSRPRTEPYGDDQILRKVGRYRIGLSYAKMS